MKKLFSILLFSVIFIANAQVTANRFLYELTFKPKTDSAKMDKVMAVLDITPEKSIFRDYTIVSQDSILKEKIELMQKTGNFRDLSKEITTPKFSYKIIKTQPKMEVQYIEGILNGMSPIQLMYKETPNFNWNILSEKEKIGEYNTQKATTDFGGRKWTAWFSTDIPLQDGPYKFYGLPGLIVKIKDDGNNYTWELKGNEKVNNFEEVTYVEKITPGGAGAITEVPRERFEKTFAEYKKDPFSSFRSQMTPQMMSQKIPGQDKTLGEIIKEQEKKTIEFYNANNNPIELEYDTKKKK
ncbi:MAG: GLPGLI family protein [Cruoricaptor ignavus]|nr:GLPGLI family protein [Cruoricaptor ignavus]